jgi:excisionase family DNA binding protein
MNIMNTLKKLLTVPEVADILSIGRTKAYQLTKSKEIPSIGVGRGVRVHPDALAEYINKQGASAK